MKQVRRILALCSALSVFSSLLAPTPSADEVPAANKLMIAVDDLSDCILILQSHPGMKTPNCDRLAKRSVNFTRAHCAAPICNPSRVADITGMAPHQTGVYQLGDRMSRSKPALEAVSLEENFARHGYPTYLTGKYYHAKEEDWLPKPRLDAAWMQRLAPFRNHEPRNGPNRIIGGGILSSGPASIGVESMPDSAIGNNTRGWLWQKHDKPFFIVPGITKPHLSFVVPQQFFDLYPLDSLVLPKILRDDYDDIPESVKGTSLRRGDLEKFAKIRETKNRGKEVMQAHLASISFCDSVLGQNLDALEASLYSDKTIVVLWSDYGYHIGEREWLHKRALWTQTTRVPFLISVPGLETAGENCIAPVSLLDIYPTLNELCHFDQNVPQTLAGHSLTYPLKHPSHDWPHVAVTSHVEGNAAVTYDRYHYIKYADGSEEMYDHQTDPREFKGLAQRPELKSVIKRIAASLPKSWKSEGIRRRIGTTDSQRDTEE